MLSVPLFLWVHCTHQPSVYGCIGTHGTRLSRRHDRNSFKVRTSLHVTMTST